MGKEEQNFLFDFGDDGTPKVKKELVPEKAEAVEKAPVSEQSHGNNIQDSDRREMTSLLSDYLSRSKEHYYTVNLPRRLLSVMAFPVTSQDVWKAIHKSENFTIETGVSEGCPERKAEVMTVRDFGYFLALYSIVSNTPVPDVEVMFTLRHIGYIMAGFPESDVSIGYSNQFINGRIAKEFGEALEKAYGRHLHYIEPSRSKSSGKGRQHWLSLLNYEAVDDPHMLPGGKKGRFYKNIQVGSAFLTLAKDTDEMVSFDLKMFFSLRTQLARGILLYLLPRLLAGGYNSRYKHYKIDARLMLPQIGASARSYRSRALILETLESAVNELDKVESILGTRLRVKVDDSDRKQVYFLAYLEKSTSREKQKSNLLSLETYKLWSSHGGSEGEYLSRIFEARKNRQQFDEDDQEIIAKLNLNVGTMLPYLNLVKQLIGRPKFQACLAEYRASCIEGNASINHQTLTGFLKDAIKLAAIRSE
jgi:hypothetical protein